MSSSLGQLTLDIVANVGGFEDGMTKAERVADKKLRAIEFAAQQRTKAIEDAFSNMATSLAAPLAAAFSVGAITGYVQHIRTAAVEVDRFAKIAGSSSQEFQRYAYGATKAGVEVDKFADIMKDVNERFGEFAQTGGGEMKDFFENIAPKVGVTAEAFRNLSGPQALGLYYSTLQKANLSHAETTFYMEALASDASLLVPLLRDNAKGFKEAGEEAERLGLVLGEDLKRETLELDNNLKVLAASAEGFALKIGNVVIPELNELAGEFLATRQAGLSFWDALTGTLFDGLDDSTKGPETKIKAYRAELEDLQKRINEMGGPSNRDTSLMVDRANKLKGFISYTEIRQSADAMTALRAVIADTEAGITDYTGAVQRLQSLHAGGAISAAQFQSAIQQLNPVAAKVAQSMAGPLAQGAAKAAKTTKQAGDAIGDLIEKLEAKELEEAAKAVEAYNAAWATHLDTLWDQAEALENQVKLFGKSETQLAELALARAEERLQIAKALPVEKAYIEALEQEVVQRRRIAEASRSMESLEANRAAAEQARRDWEDTSKFIEQSIYDAIVSGGEDAGDVLKRTFKALVLEPMIRTVAQAGANIVTDALGFGGQGGGSGSTLANGLSIANNGYQLASGVGASTASLAMANMAGTFGADAMGTMIAGNAATWGVSSAGVSGAASVMGAAAAAMPYVAIALAVLSMIDWGGGTPHKGAAVFAGPDGVRSPLSYGETQSYYADPADADGFGEKDFYRRRQQAMADALSPLALSAAGVLNGALEAFDKSGGYQVGLAFSADGDDRSRGRLSIIDNAGKEIIEFARKYNKDAQKGFADFAADVGPELRNALVAADLPGWVDDILTSLGEAPSMEQLSAVMGELSAFVDGAMTQGEAWRKATESLSGQFADLGVTMPRSTREFNALVQASGDLGAELYALGPAFYQLSSIVEQTFAAISQTTAESVRDIEMSVLDNKGKYSYLDTEINGLLAQLDKAVDPATAQGLFEQINSRTMAAFNLLDGKQQQAKATEFIDRLYEAEARAQARLSVAPLPAAEASAESTVAAQKQAAVDLSAAAKQLGTLLSEMSGQVASAESLRAASAQLQGASRSLAGIAQSLASEVGY